MVFSIIYHFNAGIDLFYFLDQQAEKGFNHQFSLCLLI